MNKRNSVHPHRHPSCSPWFFLLLIKPSLTLASSSFLRCFCTVALCIHKSLHWGVLFVKISNLLNHGIGAVEDLTMFEIPSEEMEEALRLASPIGSLACKAWLRRREKGALVVDFMFFDFLLLRCSYPLSVALLFKHDTKEGKGGVDLGMFNLG